MSWSRIVSSAIDSEAKRYDLDKESLHLTCLAFMKFFEDKLEPRLSAERFELFKSSLEKMDKAFFEGISFDQAKFLKINDVDVAADALANSLEPPEQSKEVPKGKVSKIFSLFSSEESDTESATLPEREPSIEFDSAETKDEEELQGPWSGENNLEDHLLYKHL